MLRTGSDKVFEDPISELNATLFTSNGRVVKFQDLPKGPYKPSLSILFGLRLQDTGAV